MDSQDLAQQFEGFVAVDPAMIGVLRMAGQVAQSDLDVVLVGESGVGKELIAQGIHRLSRRSKSPLIAISMAAVPEAMIEAELFGHHRGAFTGASETRAGRFEQANTGTLFLDEIGSLPLALQPKLLRALQEKAYYPLGGLQVLEANVRVIAATDKDLVELVKNGKFEKGLYFRFQVSIQIPALRQRPADIGAIANAHLQVCNLKYEKAFGRMSPAIVRFLERQPWPGNVRQLLSVVEWAIIQGRPGRHALGAEDFESILADWTDIRKSNGEDDLDTMTIDEILAQLARSRLLRYRGNRTEAAKSLGVTRGTFRNWCYRYKIEGFDHATTLVGSLAPRQVGVAREQGGPVAASRMD